MNNRRNYYRILQVQPDAPTEVIRASFRTMMRELKQHPDLGGSALDASMLNEAYEVLTDPKRRVAYDSESLARYTGQPVPSAGTGKPPLTIPFCPFCKRPLARRTRPGESCRTCQIPLQSAKKAGLGHISRRSIARMKKNGSVNYCSSWPGEAQQAKMIDLSPKGMRFICREKLRSGAVLKIMNPLLRASATVTNLREEMVEGERCYSVGVSFLAVEFADCRGLFLSVSA